MKRMPQYGFMGASFIFGAVAFIYGALSYFFRSVGPNNTVFDGLGRQLDIAPLLVRFLYMNDTLWPGFYWAVFDWILFFGLLGLAYLMINLSTKYETDMTDGDDEK